MFVYFTPLAEAAKVARFRDEMNATERAMTVLRAQLTVCADQATRKQNELQNSLQASRQFLDEVRLEYEDYAETTKSEFELYRAAKTHEVRMVRQVRRNTAQRAVDLISHCSSRIETGQEICFVPLCRAFAIRL